MSNPLYAVEHCPCVYESGFEQISLHATRRGAAKAMNHLKSQLHQRFVEGVEGYNDGIFIVCMRREPQFYGMQAFRYRLVEVCQ